MSSIESHDARLAVLSKLRAFRDEITSHVAHARGVQTELLSVLRQASSMALYRFESTEQKLLHALEVAKEQVEFLAGKGQGMSRLFVGKHIFNKASFASYVLKQATTNQAGITDEEAGSDVIGKAKHLLSQRQATYNAQLSGLRAERKEVQAAARNLLAHVANSVRYGLLAGESASVKDIQAGIWFAFEEGYIPTVRQSEVEARAKRLFEAQHLLHVFTQLTTDYQARLQANQDVLLARKRSEVLRQAAKQFASECIPAESRETEAEQQVREVLLAITGIHFAFACEQNLDCGKMTPETRIGYENRLHAATPVVVERAIRELLSRQILLPDDLRLLRYVQPVQAALESALS